MCVYVCAHVRVHMHAVCVLGERKEELEGLALYPQMLVNLASLKKNN